MQTIGPGDTIGRGIGAVAGIMEETDTVEIGTETGETEEIVQIEIEETEETEKTEETKETEKTEETEKIENIDETEKTEETGEIGKGTGGVGSEREAIVIGGSMSGIASLVENPQVQAAPAVLTGRDATGIVMSTGDPGTIVPLRRAEKTTPVLADMIEIPYQSPLASRRCLPVVFLC